MRYWLMNARIVRPHRGKPRQSWVSEVLHRFEEPFNEPPGVKSGVNQIGR
jgi:hypothetical protein